MLCVAKGSQHGASAVKMELWAPEGGVRGSLLNRAIDQEFNGMVHLLQRTTAMTLKQQLEYYAYTYTYAYPSSAASTNDGGFDRAVMLCPAARSPRLPY